ncbi:MAG: cation diffusion facilitator family transporter [Treponemataceae bacterium]|nr:cation diffusion facilitator family transporter [Treponemataceae bacterium]
MIKLLAKLFIKDYKNFKNPSVRTKYGVVCAGFGIFLNLLLFAGKFITGKISGSMAIAADAFNNLSDAASSIVSIFGFSMAEKKPDSKHPFGHGRIEYISGLIISFLIMNMGFELFTSSIEAIKTPKTVQTSALTIGVMTAAILVKLYMFIYNHQTAKKIDSASMEATAKDSFSDMFATGAALAASLVAPFVNFPIDAIAGCIVALFILYTGFGAAKETIAPLLGQPPSKELVEQIEETVRQFEHIIGIHDMIVHDYGPGRLVISLHAEVPGDKDIFILHDEIDLAEKALYDKFNCLATIHLDPIDTKNARLADLKKLAQDLAVEVNPKITIHDVRMVPGLSHTNLIFDVVRPYDCKLSAEELQKYLWIKIHEKENDVYCVITVDNPLV